MATEEASETRWKELARYPYEYSSCMVTTKDNKIIAAPAISISLDQDPKGLLWFNTNTIYNKWELFMNYPKDLQSSSHVLAYNPVKNELYLFGSQGRIVRFDIDKQMCEWRKEKDSFGSYPASIFIDNEFHIISSGSATHCIYNEKTRAFDQVKKLPKGLSTPKFIYSPQRNILYLFATTRSDDDENAPFMWIYDLQSKQWNKKKLDTWLPKFADCVMTSDERYVLMFGGKSEHATYSDQILIMDLSVMKTIKSKMKCPTTGRFRVALCHDRNEKNDALIDGFVRRELKEDMDMVPIEILKMIAGFYCDDYIHLVKRSGSSGRHWRIKVDKIF